MDEKKKTEKVVTARKPKARKTRVPRVTIVSYAGTTSSAAKASRVPVDVGKAFVARRKAAKQATVVGATILPLDIQFKRLVMEIGMSQAYVFMAELRALVENVPNRDR